MSLILLLLGGNMHSGFIMVVEDDEDLRELYVDALKTRGFKVQAYSSTKEALDEISDDPRKYRLVISDVMMKHMNGSIFANKVKEINKDIRVIRISGFYYKGMDLSHSHYDKFIQIPVTMSELLATVNEVLEMSPQLEVR
jgi:two-component system, cell cycle sensor histidine kinase and response regulator CckA